MLDFFNKNQVYMELCLMAVCLLIFCLTLITGNLSKKRRFAILLLEISSFLWITGTFFYNVYKSNITDYGWYLVRLGKFLDYFFSNFIVFAFGLYLKDFLYNEGKVEKMPVRLLISDIIVFISLITIIISLFTGFYYYFDQNSLYQRGPGRLFFYILSSLPLLLQFTCVVKSFKKFSLRISIPMTLFIILPLFATVLQFFYKGLYISSMSTVGMSVVLYIFTIQEMNHAVEKAHRMEVEMLERYKKELEETVDLRTQELRIANEKANNLLLNILPESVAKELTENPEKTISKKYPNATVLFTDIVGFTKLSSTMTAEETVTMLNTMFSLFDERCEKEGIEKIKTIGDAYMAVCGLSESSQNDGALKMISFAKGLIKDVEYFNSTYNMNISIRIGINSGNLVAGVIGKKKFIYDIWGDTVNVASRMESTGSPMKIHVSQNVYEQTKDKISYSNPIESEVKGKGMMKSYLCE
ncbi:MAG: adenylate/guanylate cyclase domain-containing protein [Treponema sp.]|nr:adenylate/guanylate cyclase domain-containing protein [Treponema sp.]